MVQAILTPMGIAVRSAREIGIELTVEEDGATPQDNARKKALAYVRLAGKPVLSIDNALYLRGLPPEEQPGLHVRRLPGGEKRPSDQALLTYYQALIRRLGEKVEGWWEFALALAQPNGDLIERTVRSPRLFVSHPSPQLLPGYPLESLQIDPKTGRYISEMSREERANFWQQLLGEPLRALVREAFLNAQKSSASFKKG